MATSGDCNFLFGKQSVVTGTRSPIFARKLYRPNSNSLLYLDESEGVIYLGLSGETRLKECGACSQQQTSDALCKARIHMRLASSFRASSPAFGRSRNTSA